MHKKHNLLIHCKQLHATNQPSNINCTACQMRVKMGFYHCIYSPFWWGGDHNGSQCFARDCTTQWTPLFVVNMHVKNKNKTTTNNCIATNKIYININFNNKQMTQNTIVWLLNNIYSQHIFTIDMILAGVARTQFWKQLIYNFKWFFWPVKEAFRFPLWLHQS